MLYINSFEITPDVMAMDKSIDNRIEYLKKERGGSLGRMITEEIGFEKYKLNEIDRWKLEVLVFSRKRWEEFYENLMNAIDNMSDVGAGDRNCETIKLLIKQLDEK